MSSVTVLQLRCPGCGGTLHGSPQAVLFWCECCRAVVEAEQGRFVPRRVETARSNLHPSGRLCRLPIWAFRVRANWDWPDPTVKVWQAWQPPDWVYVTAFALSNAFYFGDPGLIFTQKHVKLAAADPAPLIGGTRSLDEARAFVEFHILSILDRRVDVTGVELHCVIDDAVLWGIPYYDDGLTLVDGILGLKMPCAALDEIDALRTWWGRS
jgi:hypothetical protein